MIVLGYKYKRNYYKARALRITRLSNKSLLGQGYISGKPVTDILRGSPGSPLFIPAFHIPASPFGRGSTVYRGAGPSVTPYTFKTPSTVSLPCVILLFMMYPPPRMYHESPCALPGFVGCIAPGDACIGSYAQYCPKIYRKCIDKIK
jgi:hypothetical protein